MADAPELVHRFQKNGAGEGGPMPIDSRIPATVRLSHRFRRFRSWTATVRIVAADAQTSQRSPCGSPSNRSAGCYRWKEELRMKTSISCTVRSQAERPQ
jgi:hypothetical protein